ncbi:MAG: glycosyltransferase family 1 protein [Gemmatimonadales bacterium]|nr:glycosyltransferase family 1 protein [Gemmatimonadales bacterium]
MKISLVTDTFLPEVNGVTTVLATMRAGLIARGHAVSVVAPRYPGAPGGAEPAVTRRPSVPCPGYAQVRLSWAYDGAVGRALAAAAPDVVHVITEGPLGFVGRRWALRRGIPLVTSFHTDFPQYAVRYLGGWARRPAEAYLRWFHGAAAVVQTPSDDTRARLEALGLPQAVTWGRGVETARFTPARRSERRRAAHGGTFTVLHVGRLAREKDLDALIVAFTQAHAQLGGTARFVVAGDGPEAAMVRRALPFAEHLGFLHRDVLADLYADADLFVFPSRTETCGLVALEAMACGLPVVTADEGGVLENVRHDGNGLAVRAGDGPAFAEAIVRLATDAPQRQRLAAGALAFAASRGWEPELDRLVPMYEGAARGRPMAQERVLAVASLHGGASHAGGGG